MNKTEGHLPESLPLGSNQIQILPLPPTRASPSVGTETSWPEAPNCVPVLALGINQAEELIM